MIGRVLGLICGGVTILADVDDEASGSAAIADPWVSVDRWMDGGRAHGLAAALRARIIAFMAGAEAEIDWLGLCAGGDEDDRRQIDLMLDSLLPLGADVPAYAVRLHAIAHGLVRRHRTRIGLVAAALLKRGVLTDADVTSLMLARETE